MSETPYLSRLDLNLLVSLDALLSERSVTRAAERLRLSQPALSASLARLRTHFGDPLLARRGNTYELTPLAVRLAEHTSTALDSARRVFESQAMWTPHESTREFTIFGSDYGFTTIGPRVTALASRAAPGVRFRFVLHTPAVVSDAAHHLRSVDGMILPHGFLTDLPYADLWSDDWVLLVADSNTRVGEHATMADLAESPWVFTYQSRTAYTSATQQLHQLGLEPRVEAVVESFLALPHFVLGSNRLALVQRHLADSFRGMSGIRILPLPFDATPIVNALWWHPVHSRDPEHTWMRELITQAATELTAP
ncbi:MULTISPECIES: LysR family transcriptional regulator [unclassified Microbacterium]|uniref:LysR family transcriptional regulator n=1 Tax=unclassified Microbacterium TaxID=2609290 RepID=UPI00097EBEA8|nr:LysR family transcriptional regulator [Microbacterium sp. JB110]RCS57262.1 LysR family transcriptional regulator [Microbacterium sp. JB110]SJM58827.1 Nodulation protein D (transcriptional regulator, LysR family) [Frigoribacterium sp. JB110]